ncbi:hypothetical protein OROHE_019565 [Orobanche hederae]
MCSATMSLSRSSSRLCLTNKVEAEQQHNNKEDDGVVSFLRCSSSPIRSTTTAQQQSFWSKFPVDIILEILLRLPETDLITSKFVSKDWNFVISRVCLPRLCLPYPSALLCGLLIFEDYKGGVDPVPPDVCPDRTVERYWTLKFVAIGKYLWKVFASQVVRGHPIMPHHIMPLLPSRELKPSDLIQDCCNGLLLFASDSQYYVGNPATRQRIAISVNPNNHTNCRNIYSSLVFDPSISVNFKIVSFTRPAVNATSTDQMGLDIFSSETGAWSSHILPLEPHSLYGVEWIRRPVYFDGALYYLSLAMYLVRIENIVLNSSASMDCSDLKAWSIALPDKDETTIERDKHHFGCIGNSLGCFYYSNRVPDGSSMLVWMLVRKKKSCEWVLKHSISISQDINSNCLYGGSVIRGKKLDIFRPRAFHPNDDEIFMASPGVLISYHLKTKKVAVCRVPKRMNREIILLDQNWIFPFSRCLLILSQPEKLRE